MSSLLKRLLNFNRKIKKFHSRDLISNAALLLYKEFDENIGFRNPGW